MLDPSDGLVVHPEVAHQLQRRQVGLSRGLQVDRQRPGVQRQLGGLEEGATEQRHLIMAGSALVVDLSPRSEAQVLAVAAAEVEEVAPAKGRLRMGMNLEIKFLIELASICVAA